MVEYDTEEWIASASGIFFGASSSREKCQPPGLGQAAKILVYFAAALRHRQSIALAPTRCGEPFSSALLGPEGARLRLIPVQDVEEVSNYVASMKLGLERLVELPVSSQLIREIHARLMSGVRGSNKTPGAYRTSQNWIGRAGATLQTADFVPQRHTKLKNV